MFHSYLTLAPPTGVTAVSKPLEPTLRVESVVTKTYTESALSSRTCLQGNQNLLKNGSDKVYVTE